MGAFEDSPLFGGDGINYGDPKTMALLAALGGFAQGGAAAAQQQVTPWGLRKPGLFSMLAGATGGAAQGALAGPQLAQRFQTQQAQLPILEQQAEAARTKNALDKITLAYYQRRNAPGLAAPAIAGSMAPAAAPSADPTAAPGAPQSPFSTAPDQPGAELRPMAPAGPAGAAPMSFNGPMPAAASPAPAMPGGAAPMLFDPRALAAQYGELSAIPGMAPQAQQILKLIEQMQLHGGGFTADGGYRTVPNFNESRQATKAAETKGETLGKPPEIKNVVMGEREVPHQFNPETWKFEPVPGAGGPRWQGDQTLTQIVDPKDPTRSIWVPRHQAIGQESMGAHGMVMMPNPRDPNGPPILMQGNAKMLGNLPGMLTQGAQTKVQEDALSMTAQNAQMQDILHRLDPAFQTFATKGAQWWNTTKEKLGANLKPEEKAKLQEFTQYRAAAGQYFADRLKAMSGSAVTAQEMTRQEAYLPNPGDSVFNGDSPTEFKSKAERMATFMTNATARLHYIQTKGLSIKDVPLDDMPRVIRERGAALAKDFEAQGIKGDALKVAVKQRLANDFGLVSD